MDKQIIKKNNFTQTDIFLSYPKPCNAASLYQPREVPSASHWIPNFSMWFFLDKKLLELFLKYNSGREVYRALESVNKQEI